MNPYFLNCDWGTSRFRLRLVETATSIIRAERKTWDGVLSFAGLEAAAREARFQDVLQQHIASLADETGIDLKQAPVLISGMASSTIGWQELPYATVPFQLTGADLSLKQIDLHGHEADRSVYLISGLRSEYEVMRGEEVELMGIAEFQPAVLYGSRPVWVILPGTHSKHVRVQNGVVVDFHTHMTGELFQLLGKQSSLRHRDAEQDSDRTIELEQTGVRDAFLAGVNMARDDGLGAALFQTRTRQILRGEDAETSAAFLSGLLVGDELLALQRRRSGDEQVLLAAAQELSKLYEAAFVHLDCSLPLIVVSPGEVVRLSALGQARALRRLSLNGR